MKRLFSARLTIKNVGGLVKRHFKTFEGDMPAFFGDLPDWSFSSIQRLIKRAIYRIASYFSRL